MVKKLLLLMWLGYVLVAQAAPDDAIILRQDQQLANAVPKYTSAPNLRSAIALVYDEQGQRPLYSKNADTVVPIASVTKIMTAMVVLDAQLPPEEEIRISTQDMDRYKGTRSRIRPGTVLTRGELLMLALMSSENSAAAALARTFPGGSNAAVAMMNAKARELGMHDTYFREPTGLHSSNVSTAQDLVKMIVAAQQYEAIRQYTTASSYMVQSGGGRSRPIRFGNTNPLVKNASWEIGLSKTGYISEAGNCLVMAAKITQRPVIIVLLDSWGKHTRVGDANRVRKWMEGVSEPGSKARRG